MTKEHGIEMVLFFNYLFITRADKDGNGLLDEKELATYVKDAIEAHLEKAMKDNFDHYFRIDKEPRNGTNLIIVFFFFLWHASFRVM